jgi:spoIIIJ-associated protein
LIENVLRGVLQRSGLDLDFTVRQEKGEEFDDVYIEFFGPDKDVLTEREGQLMDAFQLLVMRATQHQIQGSKVNVHVDCDGWREENTKALIDLAEKSKEKALEQGRSIYLKALSSKDRKVIHQHLLKDERVRSRSVGEGLFKKIKIYPVRNGKEDGVEDRAEESLS